MEPTQCAHPACNRFTFNGPKCARHTFDAAEACADASESARPGHMLLDADAARGIPAVFGGSVRVSTRWAPSRRVRNVSRRERREQVRRMRETSPVALVGNADRYSARLALLGATGDQNH